MRRPAVVARPTITPIFQLFRENSARSASLRSRAPSQGLEQAVTADHWLAKAWRAHRCVEMPRHFS
jgi:hypothetical protein